MLNKKIIIANWKMNFGLGDTLDLIKKFKKKFAGFKKGEVVVCPTTLSLSQVSLILSGSRIKFGAQNVFWEESGSYTGETSADSLAEIGCRYVILGHSERR